MHGVGFYNYLVWLRRGYFAFDQEMRASIHGTKRYLAKPGFLTLRMLSDELNEGGLFHENDSMKAWENTFIVIHNTSKFK